MMVVVVKVVEDYVCYKFEESLYRGIKKERVMMNEM